MRAEGWTAVLCRAEGCCFDLPLMTALRAAVRAAPHAVLLSTGCTLGPMTCRSRADGAIVLVQPCDAARRPVGAATHVGPIRTADDLADVVAWLRGGVLDPERLASHLRIEHTRRRLAHQN